MSASRKYSEELRDRATRMALQARCDPARSHGAIARIADQLGVHTEAVSNWVRQAEVDGGLRAIRHTERLVEADAVASVGSKGDRSDNAMAEALNSLFKSECIRNPAMRPTGGWKNMTDVEIAVTRIRRLVQPPQAPRRARARPPREYERALLARQQNSHCPETPGPRRGREPTNRASTKPGAIH